MIPTRRHVATGTLAAATAAALAVSLSGPATAGGSASGSGRFYPNSTCKQLGYSSPTTYHHIGGYVQVFYSRSRNANCVHAINTTGKKKGMYVQVGRWTSGNALTNDRAEDWGNYSSYAGSVVLLRATGCIYFYGGFTGYEDNRHSTGRDKAHCG